LPRRATEGGRAGPAFTGIVCSGLGEGARFTAIDWVSAAFRRQLGFEPWPGTLNLRMDGAEWAAWRGSVRTRPGIVIEPPPGFCAAKCFPVVLNDRAEAAAVVPDVDDYPADKLELIAPVALRAALTLEEGDRVRVRLLA
jgi:CTP-dependent riboflavin kinase